MFLFEHLSAEQVESFYVQTIQQVEAKALLLHLNEIVLPEKDKDADHFSARAHVADVLPRLKADFAATLGRSKREEEEEICPNGTGT
jgi:hypothetical protein